MNQQKLLGPIREVLAMLSAALITYGIGSDALWQEVTGTTIGVIMLYWGWRENDGYEALFTILRKALSSASGVLVITGLLDPSKADALLGVIFAIVPILWSVLGKSPGDNISGKNGINLLLLLCACTFLLPGCVNGVRPTISLVTPWGSATSDSKGGITTETKWFSGWRDATGKITLAPKAPIVLWEK